MVDIQKVIETILSDSKFATSRNLASKVYQDEPILITAAQMERRTPSKYLAMRKMAQSHGLYQASEAKIFYEQGKFMEEFDDDFDYQGEFARYFPTYQSMTDQQLRGYFSWRAGVRRGQVEKTSLSFAFVYIYELLNQIGVASPEEGFRALKNFWATYREIDSQIDSYAKMWLKDYVVYHNLDQSLVEDFSETDFDRAVLVLLDHKSRGVEEVFSALNFLSSYNLENSRFFKIYPDDVKKVACDVFASFSDHYGKNCTNTLCGKFFGKVYASSYAMFKSAVFYHQVQQNDRVYEINDIHKFTLKNGSWTCERFFRYGDRNPQVGALLKTIDFQMRRKYGFKSTLKAGKTTKLLEGLINKAIDNLRESKQAAARPKIEIDVAKLQHIRRAALETQNRLTVENTDEFEASEFYTAKSEEPVLEYDADLGEAQKDFLGRLLYGRPYDDLLKSKGLMLSVLIDGINEKLFDRFGDTVIVEIGDRPELVEDYIDELKEMIRA